MNDADFLFWIRDRLVLIYKENSNADFVHRLEKIAGRMAIEAAAARPVRSAGGVVKPGFYWVLVDPKEYPGDWTVALVRPDQTVDPLGYIEGKTVDEIDTWGGEVVREGN